MPTEILDIFDQDAFQMVTLTAAVNLTPYAPDYLGSLGIFTPAPARTIDVAIVMNDDGNLEIVQTTPRGAPPYEQKVLPQNLRSVRSPRIAIGDTIYAHELQGILARGVFSGGDIQVMLADLQGEMAYRMDGPTGLRSKVEATKEHMRLGAIAGQVLDKDGTVLYDWPTVFGRPLPPEIGFDLLAAAPPPGTLQQKVRELKRSMMRAARAGNRPVRVVALCGDHFFDALTRHPDVLPSWNIFQSNASTRIAFGLNSVEPFTSFQWEGVEWVNYRGTDDTTSITVDPDKCKFVPVGIPGLFSEVLSPYESFDYVNTLGLPIYANVIRDLQRNQWVRLEAYSYPIYLCTRPDVLYSGRIGP